MCEAYNIASFQGKVNKIRGRKPLTCCLAPDSADVIKSGHTFSVQSKNMPPSPIGDRAKKALPGLWRSGRGGKESSDTLDENGCSTCQIAVSHGFDVEVKKENIGGAAVSQVRS